MTAPPSRKCTASSRSVLIPTKTKTTTTATAKVSSPHCCTPLLFPPLLLFPSFISGTPIPSLRISHPCTLSSTPCHPTWPSRSAFKEGVSIFLHKAVLRPGATSIAIIASVYIYIVQHCTVQYGSIHRSVRHSTSRRTP